MPFNAQMHAELMSWLMTHPNVLSEDIAGDLVHMNELSARDHQALVGNLLQVAALAPILKKYVTSNLATLPKELIKELGTHFNQEDIKKLAKTSMGMNSLFSNIFPKFLECVAYGKQEEAEQLLKSVLHGRDDKIQNVLLYRGKLTDYSGRTFECSAYEYAYWAKDTHMCRMLQGYMNEETKAKVAIYIDSMCHKGLSYHQNGEHHQSTHFDFTPFVESLAGMSELCKDVIVAFRNLPHAEINRVSAHFEEKAGLLFKSFMKAQMDFPAHVIQEYCHPKRAFSPCPRFDESHFPRSSLYSDTMYNEIADWFPRPELDFENLSRSMLFRGSDAFANNCMKNKNEPWVTCEEDLSAITCLNTVRTEELKDLREGLNPALASSSISKNKPSI
jgi:hypothetical protein